MVGMEWYDKDLMRGIGRLSTASQVDESQVDDERDKARLTALYSEHDPTKMQNIASVLTKRPTQGDRDKISKGW
jgi:hypothetical protein